jgi:hypothetical protein
MICYVCLHLQQAVGFRSTFVSTTKVKTALLCLRAVSFHATLLLNTPSLPFYKAKLSRQTVSRKFVDFRTLEM